MNFTVALTEDNSINRNTILQKIRSLGNMQMVFVAANGQDCLDKLNSTPEEKLPQVVFMDIEMPKMNGIEAIRIAKSTYPQIHFIVLTVFDDDEKIFDAIKAGASGYLLKHESEEVLQESVMNVLEFGGAPMSPAISRKALQLLGRSVVANNDGYQQDLPEMITSREEEILKHMVNGWDAKRIAAFHNISILTVRKHIANIYRKLHVQSKTDIILLAQKKKWFSN